MRWLNCSSPPTLTIHSFQRLRSDTTCSIPTPSQYPNPPFPLTLPQWICTQSRLSILVGLASATLPSIFKTLLPPISAPVPMRINKMDSGIPTTRRAQQPCRTKRNTRPCRPLFMQMWLWLPINMASAFPLTHLTMVYAGTTASQGLPVKLCSQERIFSEDAPIT